MLAKHLAIGLVSSALVAGTALAQTTAPAPSAPAPSAAASSTSVAPANNWRTSKLIGVNVYNESNEKLGSIDEMITDKQGKIAKVIIGVGGFLGMGQHDIAVNFDQLKFSDTPVPSTVSSTSTTTSPNAPSSTVGSSSTSSSATARSTADNWYPDHAVMAATKDQLKAMPEFKYDTTTSSK
jgi:hypothetical protein